MLSLFISGNYQSLPRLQHLCCVSPKSILEIDSSNDRLTYLTFVSSCNPASVLALEQFQACVNGEDMKVSILDQPWGCTCEGVWYKSLLYNNKSHVSWTKSRIEIGNHTVVDGCSYYAVSSMPLWVGSVEWVEQMCSALVLLDRELRFLHGASTFLTKRCDTHDCVGVAS